MITVDVSREIKRILSQMGNVPPEAKIKVSPEKPRLGEIVTVTSASKDPDGRIFKYKWIIYEDGEEIKEEENVTAVSFEVETGKTYTVELTVVDDAGAKIA